MMQCDTSSLAPADVLDVSDVNLTVCRALVTTDGADGHMALAAFSRLTFCMPVTTTTTQRQHGTHDGDMPSALTAESIKGGQQVPSPTPNTVSKTPPYNRNAT
jgi:hypothetical protein